MESRNNPFRLISSSPPPLSFTLDMKTISTAGTRIETHLYQEGSTEGPSSSSLFKVPRVRVSHSALPSPSKQASCLKNASRPIKSNHHIFPPSPTLLLFDDSYLENIPPPPPSGASLFSRTEQSQLNPAHILGGGFTRMRIRRLFS